MSTPAEDTERALKLADAIAQAAQAFRSDPYLEATIAHCAHRIETAARRGVVGAGFAPSLRFYESIQRQGHEITLPALELMKESA